MEYQKLLQIRRQKGMEIAQRKKITNHDGIWLVPSQSNPKQAYKVQLSLNGSTCTCQDYVSRGIRCKHIFAVDITITKQIDEQGNTIITTTKRVQYPQKWHEYTQAQNEEGRLFRMLLKDLVENIPEKPYSFGRPSIPIKTAVFCAIDKVYSMQSSRRAYSRYKDAQEKEQIERVPNYNHINKTLNKPEMTAILTDLLHITAMPLKSIETKFAPDSTGFRTTKFNEYCKQKHHTKALHRWVKCHAITGTTTNIIVDAILTDETTNDCPQFIPLVQNLADMRFNIEEICADKAYSSTANHTLIKEIGATGYIPFRSNVSGKTDATLGTKGKAWRRAFHYFQLNYEDFLTHYHNRSNVESTFMALKTKFNDLLKSKTPLAQRNELFCKLIAYNITVLISAMFELGIKPSLLG
ncbi:MAG: transposase [Candidatus Micrarchaeota archaeon]|nr:transposase [Candidatus Micrarchaeota archaeon]